MRLNYIETGDCIEHMKQLPDACVDAVITDPPYMTTDIEFDKKGFLVSPFVQEVKRILSPDGYFVSFGGIELLGELSKTFPIRFTGVWVKHHGVMRTAAAKKPMSQAEIYSVMSHPLGEVRNLAWSRQYYPSTPYRYTKKRKPYNRQGSDSLINSNPQGWTQDGYIGVNEGTRQYTDTLHFPSRCGMKYGERTNHPTQKNCDMMRVIIRWLTNENATILDPFCGSGTTCVAAKMEGRNFIGYEINPEYAVIAKSRTDKAERVYQEMIACNKN